MVKVGKGTSMGKVVGLELIVMFLGWLDADE